MSMNARLAQTLGVLVVAGASAGGLALGAGGSSLVREAAAAPTSPSIPPPPPGGGGTMPPGYVPPTTGMASTTVPSTAKVSYEVVSDFPDVAMANVKYSDDGRLVGFVPVALPWTQPVVVAPPLAIVTVYATLPASVVVDQEDGETQEVPSDASVTCRVLVDGVVVKQDIAQGPKSTATCSVSLDVSTAAPSAPAPSGAPSAPAPSGAPAAPVVPAAPVAPAAPGVPGVTTLAPPAPVR